MSPYLDHFVHIGPRASLYSPVNATPGQIIIVCTWLGAAHRLISKYTALYQRIAPSARILLIESNVPILVSAYAYQRKQIQCAVSAVLDSLSESGFFSELATHRKEDPTTETEKSYAGSVTTPTLGKTLPRIVLHSFSNGGTNTATQLLIELRKRLSCPIPLTGIVLDSCPAKGTYWKSYNAMVFSLPPVARPLGSLAVHFLLVLLYTWIACGNENPASLMRRILLDEHTLCKADNLVEYRPDNETGSDRSVSRVDKEKDHSTLPAGQLCYLYSKADKLVEWTDIRDHAEAARSKGWRVAEIIFDGSPHCAHMPHYEDQYVNAVAAMWREAPNDKKDGKKEVATRARL